MLKHFRVRRGIDGGHAVAGGAARAETQGVQGLSRFKLVGVATAEQCSAEQATGRFLFVSCFYSIGSNAAINSTFFSVFALFFSQVSRTEFFSQPSVLVLFFPLSSIFFSREAFFACSGF